MHASPLRAQIATGSAGGGANGNSAGGTGGAPGGVTAPAVGGTGQASSAPAVGSISSPSSSGTSPAVPGAPSTNGNSNGSGSAANGNGNGAANDGGVGGTGTAANNDLLAGNGPVTLTLPQIVNIVLGNNTTVIEARQRLQLAIEQINQLNAQAKPQLRADAADTYNSYPATTTTLGPNVQNPVLPSGGTIPTITDQAASSISALSSSTAVSGTVAPGVSSSASFGPAGPAGGVGGGGSNTAVTVGGVGPGSSTATSTPSTSTSTGGNSAGTPGAPSSSGASGTGAGDGNGSGAPASTGASGGQTSGSSNGTAGQSANGAGNTGTSGTNNPGTGGVGTASDTGTSGANTNGNAGKAAGASTGSAGSNGGAAGNASGTNGAAPNSSGTNRNGTGTTGSGAAGTGTDGEATSSSSLDEPDEQLAPIPPILQAFVTAEGGGSVESDEVAQASQNGSSAKNRRLAAANVAYKSAPAQPGIATNAGGGGTGTGTGSDAEAVATSEGQRNTYAARATGSQYIDLFGYFPAARDVQDSIRDFYLLDLERIENETALAAKNTFFNVLYAQAEYGVQQEQVDYAQENVRIVTARRQQGVAADYDVLTVETALANAQQLLITARNQLQLADSQLAYLVGVNPDRQVTLLAPPIPPVNEAFNLPQSVQVAQQRRPELRQAQKNVNIASRLIKLAGATLAPTLGIVGVAQYNSTTTTFTPHSLATVSAQLGIPIDDGGATRSRVRSARVDLQTQQINLGSLQLSVSLEVRQAILDIDNAQSRFATAQVAVTQAEEARRLAVVRYENGLGTLLDVTNAVAQLATAQSNLADANFAYQTALATLIRNEGGR